MDLSIFGGNRMLTKTVRRVGAHRLLPGTDFQSFFNGETS
jgi:hypothetical protein